MKMPITSTSAHAEHIQELAGLRGCAISMVLLFHLSPDLPQNRVLAHIAGFGWSGVDLFFVLSGFLITRILLRSAHRADYFKSFYIRRSLRIFPVYYWTLGVVLLVCNLVEPLRVLLPSGPGFSGSGVGMMAGPGLDWCCLGFAVRPNTTAQPSL
jgi:peptidoglycan/LPS O-acetylase OafA/YrhL